jgi:hypothetical protein
LKVRRRGVVALLLVYSQGFTYLCLIFAEYMLSLYRVAVKRPATQPLASKRSATGALKRLPEKRKIFCRLNTDGKLGLEKDED